MEDKPTSSKTHPKPNIGRILDDEKFERRFNEALKNISQAVDTLLSEKTDIEAVRELYEKKMADVPLGSRQPSGFWTYARLRAHDISAVEIEEMMKAGEKAGEEGTLEGYWRDKIEEERETIEKILKDDAVQERFAGLAGGISDYFESRKIDLGRKILPRLQFVGNFEATVVNFSQINLPEGQYFPEVDAVLIQLDEEELEEGRIKADKDGTFIHETLHGFSGRYVEAEEGSHVLDETSYSEIRAGFFRMVPKENLYEGFPLNEGFTELVSRQIARELSLPDEARVLSFERYVEDFSALLDYLSEREIKDEYDGDEEFDEGTIREIFEIYRSENGPAELKKYLEEKVGPFTYGLFDVLSEGSAVGFAGFLKNLEAEAKGDGFPCEEIRIDVRDLDEREVDWDEASKTYPFLVPEIVSGGKEGKIVDRT